VTLASGKSAYAPEPIRVIHIALMQFTVGRQRRLSNRVRQLSWLPHHVCIHCPQ